VPFFLYSMCCVLWPLALRLATIAWGVHVWGWHGIAMAMGFHVGFAEFRKRWVWGLYREQREQASQQQRGEENGGYTSKKIWGATTAMRQ